MSEYSEERAGRGCAIFINLIFSAIVLLVLTTILLPEVIELPKWVQQVRNFTVLEKRKVLQAPVTFTNSPDQVAEYLLVFNLQRTATANRTATDQPVRSYDVLVTHKKAGVYELDWETKLGATTNQTISRPQTYFDQAHVYILFEKELLALQRSNGRILWRYALKAALGDTNGSSFAINLPARMAYLIDQDNTLTAIRLSDGRPAWQKKLSPRASRLEVYSIGRQIGLLAQDFVKSPQFYLYDASSGKVAEEIILDTYEAFLPVFYYKGNLFGVDLSAENAVLACRVLPSGTLLWSSPLPRDFVDILESTRRNARSQPFYFQGSDIYAFRPINQSGGEIIDFNFRDGRSQVIQKQANYRFSPLVQERGILLVQANPPSLNANPEIWAIDQRRGTRLWTYPLSLRNIYDENSQNFNFAIHSRGNRVWLMEKTKEEAELRITSLDLNTGKPLRERTHKTTAQDWTGLQWTRQQVYLSAGDLYAIDLETLGAKVEWP